MAFEVNNDQHQMTTAAAASFWGEICDAGNA